MDRTPSSEVDAALLDAACVIAGRDDDEEEFWLRSSDPVGAVKGILERHVLPAVEGAADVSAGRRFYCTRCKRVPKVEAREHGRRLVGRDDLCLHCIEEGLCYLYRGESADDSMPWEYRKDPPEDEPYAPRISLWCRIEAKGYVLGPMDRVHIDRSLRGHDDFCGRNIARPASGVVRIIDGLPMLHIRFRHYSDWYESKEGTLRLLLIGDGMVL